MKIYFYSKYDRDGASSRYRTFQYQDYYAEAGIETLCFPLFSNEYLRIRYGEGRAKASVKDLYRQRWRDMGVVEDCDLVVVEKEFLPYLPSFLEKDTFRDAKKILVDLDDAIFENYRRHGNPLVRLAIGKKFDRLLGWASGVVCGSKYLSDYAEERAEHVYQVPTTVDVSKYEMHDHDHDGLISIGWIGTPWSARYLPAIREVIETLANEIPLRFIVIGGYAPYWNGVDIQSYTWEEAKEADWIRWMDIGVMPLPDTPFERGKCGLKILQYMAAGVVPVASDVGGNSDLIEEGVDGYLCRTDNDWTDALLDLARDPQLRARMGAAGRKKVEEKYSLSVWAPKLEAIYREVAG